MTRQIKFRAWKKSEQRMVSWDEFINNPDDLISALTFVKYEKTMQYTGLKDKNGVEIYEGDVVEHANGWSGVITWNQEDCSFISANKHGTAWLAPGIQKVIGNIYENPELLAA